MKLPTFLGYRRANKRVGVRNHVIILPVDDISNAACEAVANNVKGTMALPHAYGRLQFGEDLDLFFRTMIGTGSNPNVAAVIVIGIEPGWTQRIVDGIAKTGKPAAGFSIERHGDLQTIASAARKAKVKTFVWYNYRRVPAVALAHQLVAAGRIGEIRHVRAFYLQDWAGPDVPLIWRFDKKIAGSGSNGDLNAHIVDMMRFVTGEEITEICGAIAETFVKERTLMTGGAGGGIAANVKAGGGKGKVQVDDAVLFLARFAGGGVGSFEATRMATGNQNRTGFEINGTKGAVRFNFERMNELEFYDATEERSTQGWRTIMCTHGGSHPYAEAWWPDAHVLGYEHGFINHAYDVLLSLGGKAPTSPLPDFEDAYQTQRVLEAAMISAGEKRWVKMSTVK